MKIEAEVVQKASFSPVKTQIDEATPVEKQGEQREQSKRKVEESDGISKEYLQVKIADTNNFLKPTFTDVKFQLHEDLDRYYVEVVDSASKEVVREIPPREFLDMIAKMTEFLGVLMDRRI